MKAHKTKYRLRPAWDHKSNKIISVYGYDFQEAFSLSRRSHPITAVNTGDNILSLSIIESSTTVTLIDVGIGENKDVYPYKQDE